MQNIVIFTNVGQDSDGTMMLVMARDMHALCHCNVCAVHCSGTAWHEASARYANWLVNPEWCDIPIIYNTDDFYRKEDALFPAPTLSAAGKPPGIDAIRTRLQNLDEITLLLCAPLDGFETFIQHMGWDTQKPGPKVNVVLMGAWTKEGPELSSSHNLRAYPAGTQLLADLVYKQVVTLHLVNRKRCHQLPIYLKSPDNWDMLTGKVISVSENRIYGHLFRLISRNMRIIKEQFPEDYERVYAVNEQRPYPPHALPYDAYTLFCAVKSPNPSDAEFWAAFDYAFRSHPYA